MSVETQRDLARGLMPAVDRLMGRGRAAWRSLSWIAVDRGPGSFTGTRIGVATARALAHALEVPVAPVTSVDILSWRARCSLPDRGLGRTMLAAVESKSDEMFVGISTGAHAPASVVHVVPYTRLAEFALYYEGAAAVGVPWTLPHVAEVVGGQVDVLDHRLHDPSPVALLSLSGTIGKEPYDAVEPLYLRVSQPEAAAGGGPTVWSPPFVRVRRAEDRDIAAIMELESASFLSPWPRRELVSDIRRAPASYYAVAETASAEVVGYVAVWFLGDRGHIASVAVQPRCRRRGVARLLLFAAFDQCLTRRIRAVSLEYRYSNVAAEELYRRIGFEVGGIRTGYYTDTGEDAVYVEIASLADDRIAELHARERVLAERAATP